MKKLILSLVSLLSLNAYAGPSVSGGGGTTQFMLNSDYTAGSFDVSTFSEKNGIVSEILKYYIVAGAVQSDAKYSTNYQIPGQESDSVIIVSKNLPSYPGPAMQLNFHIQYADLISMTNGTGPKDQVTEVSFRGLLATALYEGMEKSGAPTAGSTDIGNIYYLENIGCQKQTRFGTYCTFYFKTKLVK